MRRGCPLFALAVFSAVSELPASTGPWYVGAEAGYTRATFKPYYTFAYPGGVPDQYIDKASGIGFGLIGGYGWRLSDRFSAAVQGRFAFDSATWRLHIEEERADFEYNMRYSYAVSLVPSIRAARNLYLLAEAGVGQARVQEKKDSLDYTHYDFSAWSRTLMLGAGVGYALGDKVAVHVVVRHASSGRFTYKSYLKDGRHWETVRDEPSTTFVGIRVLRNF